jgi:hypothetical protein
MAITFPASPVNGQTHTENGQIFVFDSTRGYWLLKKQDQIVASTSRSTFVATAGQTVHNVSYDPSASVIVSVNGVMLNPQDVTATNGTSITFDTALTLSDEVDIVFHQPTASNLIRQDIADPMATESYVQTYVTNNSSVGVTTVADMAALIALTGMSNGDQALVTANNNLFIYSGTGWYKIATVQNDSPSAITGVSGTYELAVDGTTTTITAASTDPEGFPLTWSYSTSGLGSIATISQSDNVFTITPSTTEADAGTFTLTINATDGVNGAVNASTNLILDFIVIVANSRYTTLLATAVDTSDNNNITDTSSNNHTITVNGDAHAGTFSPYRSGGYSTYLETQTSRYYTNTSSDFDIGGTGDWSYEAWIYADNQTWPSYPRAFGLGPYYNDPKTFGVLLKDPDNSNAITVYWDDAAGQGRKLLSTTTFSQGVWHHLATCRSGNNIALFLDGTRIAHNSSYTSAIDAGNTWLYVGHTGINTEGFQGYVRDVRFINGSHPYDASVSSITVPTETLTKTTNTKFLSSTLPYLTDISDTGHSLTVSSNVSTKPFSPYDYIEYSATDHGGSVYHGGAAGYTDYIEGNYTAIGTNDFTLQFWVYPKTSSDIYAGYFSSKKSTTITGFTVAKDTIDFGTNTSSGAAFGNPNIREEAWSHVAVVRSGDNSTAYVNGKSIGTISGTGSYNIASDRFWTMQRYGYNQGGGWPGKGYISDLKISQSVDYTADFTPPTSPLSSSGADIHIKGTDASIIDKSQGSNIKLVGNTTGSTTQVKFANTKSMYFDGTGDHVEVNHEALGTGNWTIDGWVYFNSTSTSYVFDFRGVGATNPALAIQDGDWRYITNSDYRITSGVNPSINTWYHFAIVKNNGTTTLYVDGSSIGTYADSLNYLGASDGQIGKYNVNSSHNLNGYLQDFRISKGLARYTANFTPPTASLEG